MAKADTDGNGTVNQREYLAAVAADVMPTIIDIVDRTALLTSSPRSPGPKRPARAAAERAGASSCLGALGAGRPLISFGKADDLNTLRDALAAAAAPAAELVQTSAADALEAPAGDRRGRPVCWGRRDDVRGRLRLGRRWSDESTLTQEVSSLRRTLAAPVAAESDRKQQNNAVDAWLAIDACAGVMSRRKAAVETTDARALVAELATTAVALRD